jgi:CPA2 family monovalent cation:H+ antiporter-2
MPENLDLILTLTGGLAAALVFGFISQRLGLSPIVGYLVAGISLGPHTPGFIANRQLAEQLAEIGVVLLMFGVGLHFHFKELWAVRRVALPGAIVQSVFATTLAALVARGFGWDWTAGTVFGLAISVASTVVLTRVLVDNRDLHTPAGHIAVGWLVVEDLFTVLVLVLLPALVPAEEGVHRQSWLLEMALAFIKIGVLAVFTIMVGGTLIPWILNKVAETRSRELFTLCVLVIALGIAVGSAKIFGVSMALGAFLAGMVVGQSEFSLRAATDAIPMRDAFAVLFFVSVGLLFDPLHLVRSPGLVAATLAIVLLGKPAAAFAIVWLLKYPFRTAISVAVALAQIGEFSFIVGHLGEHLGILTPVASNALIATAIISITLNPLLYGQLDRLEVWAARRPKLWQRLNRGGQQMAMRLRAEEQDAERLQPDHHAVIVGYGPIGKAVTQLLRDNEITPTVIDMNLATVRTLRSHGIDAVYGDARHRDTLIMAGVPTAESLILSAAGMHGSEEVIRQARELNEKIRVLARTAYVRELPDLISAGAQTVFSSEGELALAFTEAVLRELGATPEQIDRERDRVRAELTGAPPKAAGVSASGASPLAEQTSAARETLGSEAPTAS